MISVQYQNPLQCTHQFLVRHIVFGRSGEHHVHEVFHVAKFILREHERKAGVVLVGHCSDGRHFGQQA